MNTYVCHVKKSREQILQTLLQCQTNALPSQGNFVFANVKDGIWVRDGMGSLGIGIRAWQNNTTAIRVSCPPKRSDTARVCSALRTVLMPKAMLFDMDGVIADVSKSYRAAIIATCSTYGVEVCNTQITQMKAVGNANDDWLLTQTLLTNAGINVSLSDVKMTFEGIYQGQHSTPGTREQESLLAPTSFFRALAKRFPLAIVTGRPRKDALRFLRRFDLEDVFRCRRMPRRCTAQTQSRPGFIGLKATRPRIGVDVWGYPRRSQIRTGSGRCFDWYSNDRHAR